MLSDQTIAIIKSTVPILQEHGETLTQHFYKRMFSHNPEVIPFFNRANQAAGSQQKALAAAVCAYAANIDNLGALGGAVELIAQKHASLQIKPEHYPIVGANLLASIREVLGEGATDEVIQAWGEAYGLLADILIGREKQIYDDNAALSGGWEGFRKFRVSRKEPESTVISSFYLEPLDQGGLPLFKPGQYLTVRIPTPEGQTTMRNYSISNTPGEPMFRISVKRERGETAKTPAGYVSNYLHETVAAGATLEIGPPCGEFCIDLALHSERPLVLLAAGIGITPVLSMLSTVLPNAKQEVILVYASLNPEVQAFKPLLDQLSVQYPHFKVHYCYSESAGSFANAMNVSEGLVDAALLESLIQDKNADYYFCGPKPFMIDVYQDLLKWGIPASQVHFEFFGPLQELQTKA